MAPMKFVVKYFPEITIKSKPVRKEMSRQLQSNLRKLLRDLSRLRGQVVSIALVIAWRIHQVA